LSLVPLGENGTPQWIVSNSSMFSYSDAWNAIHVKCNLVEVGDLVWFFFSIPKQVFVTWLAMRDALSTGRKLLI
jgi:hypothetical protein